MPRSIFALTPEQKADARSAFSLLDGTGITLEEAARRAIVGHRAGKKLLMPAAADLFIRSRMADNCRPSTITWYESKLARFTTMWAERPIDSISRKEIRDALEAEPVGASTRAGLARALRALWRYCAAQEPPLTGADVTHGLRVTPPRNTSKHSGRDAFLPVADVARILHGLPRHRDAYAVMFFAGLRPFEVGPLHKPRILHRHVNRSEEFIRVPDEVAKTGKARIIQRLPPTLWAWLSAAGEPESPISTTLSVHLRRSAEKLLKRRLPYDCFRHTFATYAVALLGEARTVAVWLGHEGDAGLLFNTYMGLVTHAEAVKFWALRPHRA